MNKIEAQAVQESINELTREKLQLKQLADNSTGEIHDSIINEIKNIKKEIQKLQHEYNNESLQFINS